MSSIKLGDKIIYTGMQVKAMPEAEKRGLAPAGLMPHIEKIVQQHPEPQVLLYTGGAAVKDFEWHDDSGNYEQRSCFYVSLSHLETCFAIPENDAVISGNVVHRDRSLKGMKGKIIAGNRYKKNMYYFVELEEDVGGCSADGLGKAGHCVAVDSKHVKIGKITFKTVGE